MWKHFVANMLTLMIVGLVVLGGAVAGVQRTFVAPGPLSEAICLRVAPGSNLRVVTRQLEQLEAISSATVFRVGAQYTDRDNRLRFGGYLIEPGASMDQILEIITRGGASTCGAEVILRVGITRSDYILRDLDLSTGRMAEVMTLPIDTETLPEDFTRLAAAPETRFRVTLAEGVTSWQVWDALNRAEFLTGDLPARPPEGSIAPDSYDLRRGAERGAVLAQMQERQQTILARAWENRAEGLAISDPQEAVILASIIEKEAGGPRELPIVAGVFYNRIARNMRFQMDATIIYGITRGEGQLGRGITRSDINGVTERQRHGAVSYNTYQIDGLPPTPIANPGRAAIEAALNPQASDYLFFVADGTGGHAFASTLAEHNRNVARWREIEARQRDQ